MCDIGCGTSVQRSTYRFPYFEDRRTEYDVTSNSDQGRSVTLHHLVHHSLARRNVMANLICDKCRKEKSESDMNVCETCGERICNSCRSGMMTHATNRRQVFCGGHFKKMR